MLPSSGGLSGWASAYWRGVRLLDGLDQRMCPEPVLMNLGLHHQLKARPGLAVSRESFAPEEREM